MVWHLVYMVFTFTRTRAARLPRRMGSRSLDWRPADISILPEPVGMKDRMVKDIWVIFRHCMPIRTDTPLYRCWHHASKSPISRGALS